MDDRAAYVNVTGLRLSFLLGEELDFSFLAKWKGYLKLRGELEGEKFQDFDII